VERDLGLSRITASKYLAQFTQAGILDKKKIGRHNFYVNTPLVQLLTSIESI
jgi:uncharacterized membrane protein